MRLSRCYDDHDWRFVRISVRQEVDMSKMTVMIGAAPDGRQTPDVVGPRMPSYSCYKRPSRGDLFRMTVSIAKVRCHTVGPDRT